MQYDRGRKERGKERGLVRHKGKERKGRPANQSPASEQEQLVMQKPDTEAPETCRQFQTGKKERKKEKKEV